MKKSLKREMMSQIPKSITMKQARIALLESGELKNFADAIILGNDEKLKEEWQNGVDLQRDSINLKILAKKIGMSDIDLDNLFLTASKL